MKHILLPILSCTLCVTATAETHYVGANGLDFIPEVIYVNAGDTVHWDYLGGFPHTVTTGTDCFWDGYFHESLAKFNPVVEWIIPMDAPEEIPYFCLPHCSQGMTAMIYVSYLCIADITKDAVVDVSDLLVVIDQWGQSKSKADISGDGIVDVTDLLEVVGNWGECS